MEHCFCIGLELNIHRLFMLRICFFLMILVSNFARADDQVTQLKFHSQVIEDSKLFANKGGKILKKPCKIVGAIPGATIGFFSSIPFAIAATAFIPMIHLGSGDLLEASKAVFCAPINTLYLGGVTGANLGGFIAGSSGFLAGASLGTVTAVAKNVIVYSGILPSTPEEDEPIVRESRTVDTVNNYLSSTQSMHMLTIENNNYLKQCKEALIDIVEHKKIASNDPIIIRQEWEYSVSLAHDCLRDQYISLIESPEYVTMDEQLAMLDLKIKEYSNKIEKLRSFQLNTQARVARFGTNSRLKDLLVGNQRRLLEEESFYEKSLKSLEKTKIKIKEFRIIEGDIIFYRNILLEELKKNGIDLSHRWPKPRYFNSYK